MQQSREVDTDHPLKHLTEAQFMALGGSAVVYIKHVSGDSLGDILPDADYGDGDEFHIVVSADGSPLMVADSEEAVSDWLSSRNFGIVALH